MVKLAIILAASMCMAGCIEARNSIQIFLGKIAEGTFFIGEPHATTQPTTQSNPDGGTHVGDVAAR